MAEAASSKVGVTRNRVTVSVLAAKPSGRISPPKPQGSRTDSLLNSNRSLGKKKKPLSIGRAYLLTRRLLGLLAACYCVFTSINSGWWSICTLYGVTDSSSTYEPYRATLIANYLGNATIKESRLASELLAADTSPRSYTAYLESDASVSRTGCSSVETFNDDLYGDTFVRSNFADFVAKTSYNLTFLDDYELVLPVVDCSFSGIQVGDLTSARVFYVVRARKQPSRLVVLMLSMSTQDYRLPDHHQLGSTIFVILSVLDDMQGTEVSHYSVLGLGYPFEGPLYQVYNFIEVTKEGFVVLDSIPKDPKTERTKRVLTANRSGFYITSEENQSNVKNLCWKLSQNPVEVATLWEWVGTSVLRNGWGWMRYADFFFAFDTTFNILVLLIVMFRNYQKGKIWIGDAFISFSRSLLLRGATVVVIWLMENFWTVLTFTLDDGNTLGNGIGVFSFGQIVHGDLLTLYISLAGLFGYVLRERINPTLVVALFELGYRTRLDVISWFPSAVDSVVQYSQIDYLAGMAPLPPQLTGFSPFLFWSSHQLKGNTNATIAELAPIFSTFLILLVYAPMRKLLRWVKRKYPGLIRTNSRSGSRPSGKVEAAFKSSFTMFELATGAALQDRVGLVSDYDSCVYIKGMKYASADGIYCNGYVIANGKWLIRTDDLLWVILMVITRVRLRDIYVYEVNEFTVKQTARLVYPNMLSLRELTQLNTSLLS